MSKKLKILLSAGLVISSTAMMTSPTQTFALTATPSSPTLTPTEPTEGDVAINEHNFPDPYLRKYLTKELDKDGNGYITQEQINNRYFIAMLTQDNDMPENSKISLKGIELFPNLNNIFLNNVEVIDLDVSQCKKLTEISLINVKIKDLDISKTPTITLLDLQDSTIDSINLNNSHKLRTLDMINTQIKSINLNDCISLESLRIPNVPLTQLDLSKNSKLMTLDISDTLLYNLDLSNNLEMRNLTAKNCKLGVLDITKNKELGYLVLTGSTIKELKLHDGKISVFDAPTIVGNIDLTDSKLPSLDLTDVQNVQSIKANNLYFMTFKELKDVTIDVNSVFTIKSTDKTIDLKQLAPSIDLSKVTNVKNGTLDKNTGIITITTPKLRATNANEVSYDYNCGLLNGKPYYMTVKFVKNTAPTIQANDRYVNIGDEFDPLYGVTVKDNESNDLLSKVQVSHDVDTSKLGTYKVIYTLVDDEYEVKKTINVTVIQPNTAPDIKVDRFYLTVGDEFDPLKDVTAIDAEDGDLTDKIKVIENTVDTSKAGEYRVTYEVIDNDSIFPLKASSSIPVFVTERPVIHADDVTIHVGDKFDPLKGVTATDKEEGNLTEQIKVIENTVDTSKVGTYKVTYEVTDNGRSTATKTITVKVVGKDVVIDNNNTDSNNPQTSDMTNLVGLTGLALVSGSLASVISKKKKRNK